MRNVEIDMTTNPVMERPDVVRRRGSSTEKTMRPNVKRGSMGRFGRGRPLALTVIGSCLLYCASCGTAGASPGGTGRHAMSPQLGSPTLQPVRVIAQAGGPSASPALARPAALVEALRVASQLEAAHRYFEAASAFVKAAWLSVPTNRTGSFIRAAGLFERAGRVDMAVKCLGEAARFGGAYVRVYAVSRMDRLAIQLVGRRSVLWLLRGAGPKSVLAGVMAPLNADYWRVHGNPQRAASILKQYASAMRVVASLRRQGSIGLSRRLGCLVSLKGWYRRVSQSVLRGALLALDLYASSQGVGRDETLASLCVRPGHQGGACGGHGPLHGRVTALIGPVDPKMAKLAAARAHALGVPMMAVSPSDSVATMGPRIFDYLPAPQQRTRELAVRLAKALGVVPVAHKASGVVGDATSGRGAAGSGGSSVTGSVGRHGRRSGHGTRRRRLVAVIVPKTKSAAAMAATVVSTFGQDAVLMLQYERRQTTFSDLISKMKRAHVKGVVAAVPASILELLVTQMAAAGLWAGRPPWYQPLGRRVRRHGRRGRRRRRRRRVHWVTMAATADGLNPTRFGRIRRYLQGALLCPGFYPSPMDRRWGAFVRDFQQAYGSLPDAVAAYAYEAASLLRLGVELGHVEGGDLAAWLVRTKRGGRPLFDANGRITRSSQIYRVTGSRLVSLRFSVSAPRPEAAAGARVHR